MLAWRAAKTTEEALNHILFDQGEIVPLNVDRTIHLNATMVAEPVFNSGFFTVALDGTFLAANVGEIELKSAHQKLPVLAKNADNNAQILIFLSEYTLNSALETTHKAGLLEFTARVTSTYLKTFFKNWEDVMGKHTNIKMVMQSQTAPRLEIKEGTSKVYVDAMIRILNPYTDDYDAVMMKC